MTDPKAYTLGTAILQRNAKLRAWRAVGVAIAGAWEIENGVVYCRVYCAFCGPPRGYQGHAATLLAQLGQELQRFLWILEREQLSSYCIVKTCLHLRHILAYEDKGPPEVMAIYALELLAGR